ncbi:nuclear transport factor 2 family protein [Pseudomarimonas salicorniae]|uniref:Nuclear transport factor 2 family protein n=1 Tax=Pseudomarimonas salicorniae TaxID=2933270 RepID=A0ABT0GMD9_9GAMM|nr:nuclear transport factor 2 family protein [Lysobacter sp. CAU 1642]MCK7595379.1 nuclear transport factor 2 family protein [Lysobacter sp. CAU 1642]
MESFEVLDELRRSHPDVPAPGSDAEREALERFATFFSSFTPDRVERLVPQTYADAVYFNDTLKSVRGRAPLILYLSESAEAVEDCRVEIVSSTPVQPGEFIVRWKMMIRFKRFRRGVETWTIGASHLRFDAEGRVIYHQDYWNAADGLFQHIPVLGWMIRAIKRRL